MRTMILCISLFVIQGCTTLIGTTVGTVTTVAVEVAKVPFKIADAAIDVATDDDEDE